jgi:prepilin-type N-terminal cleavage/methylation domain-containing protein
MNRDRKRSRASFTLVELLVVIIIIGVLASLITVASRSAVLGAKEARIITELHNIALAMKAYKAKYGDYPPNFNDPDAVRRHFRKAFSRSKDNIDIILNADPPLNQAEAVTFWLLGFSPDPEYPLTGGGTRMSLFEFDQSRLVQTGQLTIGNRVVYHPPALTQPYVYFQTPSSYASAGNRPQYPGTVKPYLREALVPVHAGSFQVLSAGLDDQWGGAPDTAYFPNGPFTGGDADNLTSFSPKNLENSQP